MFVEYARNAVRMAALDANSVVVMVYTTTPSVWAKMYLTHQPVEQAAFLLRVTL